MARIIRGSVAAFSAAVILMSGLTYTIPAYAEDGNDSATQTSDCTVNAATYADCMPDTALATAIAASAGKQSDDIITDADIAAITSVSARDAGIADLTGIDTFVALETVELYNNKIVDITPIGKLTALQKLGLGDNEIADIQALSSLESLKSVNISHNAVTSIEPLENSKGLEWLWASTNELTDALPVNSFPDLKGADLSQNHIETAYGITADPPKYLVITGNTNIYDKTVNYGDSISVKMPIGYDGKYITPTGINNDGTYDESTGTVTWPNNIYSGIGLVATYMSQGGGQSGDRPFSGLVRVNVTLNGSESPEDESAISDPVWVTREQNKPQPSSVATTDCQPDSSIFIQCFADANLAQAVASEVGKDSSDKVTQSDLDSIEKVSADNAGITSLAGLEHLKNLKRIFLSGNPIDNLEPLRNLDKLYNVQIYNARITDVSPLANKPDLWGLGLGNNYIADFTTMTNVPKLAWADIYDNLIMDLSFVEQWPALNALWISGNPFKDVSSLTKATGLRRLQMESNSVEDMSPLKELTPSEYSMNDNQKVIRDAVSLDEGGSVTLKSVVGRQGGYLEPKNITPTGGVFDASTGEVTWSSVRKSGVYSFDFSESDDMDYLYSGSVMADVTVNHADETAPVFSGIYDTYVTLGQQYDWRFGVKAVDDVDGDITDRIVIKKNNLDVNEEGTYGIRYYVEDDAQNGTWAGRKVTVTTATIASVKVWDKETEVGVAPSLGVAQLTWSDDNVTYEPVVWDTVESEQYAEVGSFTVNGKVRGDLSVSCTVKVKAKPVAVQSVAITGDGVWGGTLRMKAESKMQLKAAPVPSNADDKTVTWSSSDTSIAVFGQNGYVSTTSKAGTVTLTATIGDKTGTVKLTVTDRFTDVPSTAQFASGIDWLYTVGITEGNQDGSFGYGNTLTRQDMAIFLFRLAKLEGDESATSFAPTDKDYEKFSDVKKGSFGATEILWMASKGITKGNTDGTFRGTDKLSRQDAAIFLYRLAVVEGCESAQKFKPTATDYAKFKDVNESTFASLEILWMASVGITNGNSDGTFNGTGKLSRQDMAIFLQRTHEVLNK